MVTPNLAEAICFTLELALSLFSMILNLSSSSPPSPLHDAPLILFIPIAKVSWASFDKAPWDMLPLPNLFKISEMGSTCEISKGDFKYLFLKSIKSLKFIGGSS